MYTNRRCTKAKILLERMRAVQIKPRLSVPVLVEFMVT